jgi:predicted alpha/beta superfamily hydrolase
MTLSITAWQDDRSGHAPSHHTVVGDVHVLADVHSPQLGNRRRVLVYLPPSYRRGERRYPVLYFQDGQNLFDRATSFAGEEWQVDETLEALSGQGLEAIAVGVDHGGDQRLSEYNPLPGGVQPARGGAYVSFLVDTLKPLIDANFRSLPDRAHTGVVGSSMGGLISLYAFFRRPDAFGLVGALSPAFWMGRGAIYEYVRAAPLVPGRIYLDNGTHENSARRMRDLLVERGYRPGRDLKYVAEKDGEHRESAWARRLPEALRFLLGETN